VGSAIFYSRLIYGIILVQLLKTMTGAYTWLNFSNVVIESTFVTCKTVSCS